MNVLLITGGDSSEREVSLNSANNVKKALEENGHNVSLYDLNDGYEPIIMVSQKFDILFPVLHGEEGEGGKLHEFLNKIEKPIVGTRNYEGLRKAWYKIPFKEYCDKNNIPTATWKVIKTINEVKSFGFPCVLKTSNGGSSREVAIIKSRQDLHSHEAKHILSMKTDIFAEIYLPGIEITVGILDDKALPIIEIIPPTGQFFDYENKYTGKTKEIPFAPSISKEMQKNIQEKTLKIHRNFNLGTYSRTDFMVYKNTPYALDVNTIPGLTSESLLPKEAKAADINFNEFLELLLRKSQ